MNGLSHCDTDDSCIKRRRTIFASEKPGVWRSAAENPCQNCKRGRDREEHLASLRPQPIYCRYVEGDLQCHEEIQPENVSGYCRRHAAKMCKRKRAKRVRPDNGNGNGRNAEFFKSMFPRIIPVEAIFELEEEEISRRW